MQVINKLLSLLCNVAFFLYICIREIVRQCEWWRLARCTEVRCLADVAYFGNKM